MQNQQQSTDVSNIIIRNPDYKIYKENGGELFEPLNPEKASRWGVGKILSLPSNLNGWFRYISRGGAYTGLTLKAMEIGFLELQVAAYLGFFTFASGALVIWIMESKFRNNILGKITPFILFSLFVFGGEYINIEKNDRVLDENGNQQEKIEYVESTEGVG